MYNYIRNLDILNEMSNSMSDRSIIMNESNFNITRKFGNMIWIDETQELWTIPQVFLKRK